jgi:hypothetical protein
LCQKFMMSINSDFRCEAAHKRVCQVRFTEIITECPDESTARFPCGRHHKERGACLFTRVQNIYTIKSLSVLALEALGNFEADKRVFGSLVRV